jgi:hypothetical protein
VELVKPAPDVDFALAVLAPDEEGDVLLQSATSGLALLDADGDFREVGEDGTAFAEGVGLEEVDFIVIFLLVGVHSLVWLDR